MSGKKNTASEEKDSLKISQLGEELGVDPREICAVAKEMAIENAKVPASWVTAGQADRLRAKFGGNKELKEKLERKQRYLETGELPSEEKPQAPEQPQMVLGKETYELDRRKIFGVVATPGGIRVETSTTVDLKAKPPVSGITRPAPKPVETIPAESPLSSSTETSATPGEAASTPAPNKFLGVQVVPPIRREPLSADPRFGVVQAAPEPEKIVSANAPKMDMWDKLNDGRAPLDLSTPAPFEKREEKIDAQEAVEEIKQVVEAPKAPVAATPLSAVHAEPAKTASDFEPQEKTEHVPLPPKIDEVPVKWQPKHKAFGAKHKVKQKKHKLLESAEKKSEAKAEKKEHKPHKHDEPKHAHKPAEHKKEHAEHKPAKKEGLLSRLAKKFLGK